VLKQLWRMPVRLTVRCSCAISYENGWACLSPDWSSNELVLVCIVGAATECVQCIICLVIIRFSHGSKASPIMNILHLEPRSVNCAKYTAALSVM
jgi:hypothetical protein